MQTRIYHGSLKPRHIANALIGKFNRGNLKTQTLGSDDHLIVQVSTRDAPQSGGRTALTVVLQQVADGVSVQVGEQSWLGIAASLGQSALWSWLNPWNIVSRLDDIAQDIENLQLDEKTWEVIDAVARNAGAGQALSERLRRMVCEYCRVANPVGSGTCIACGAPLGNVQPSTCMNCGFVVKEQENTCPNCGKPLPGKTAKK